MENSKVALENRTCRGSNHEGGDANKSNPKLSGIRFSGQVLHPTFFFSRSVFIVLNIFIATRFGTISAQSVESFSKFSVVSTNYRCSSNLVCLGEAHEYSSTGSSSNGIEVGMLSLLNETYDDPASISEGTKGLAYYKEPVKLLDLSAQQPASFNTSFAISMRYGPSNKSWSDPGDGMAFVMSANNSTLGGSGANLGIFSEQKNATSFKSIIVEFDTFWNDYAPLNDISGNHVSLDFMNITWVAAANASDVNVALFEEFTVYAWVEYWTETEQFEVRISCLQSRPIRPLLKYTVNLFDHVEEFMWVGFSSGAGSTGYGNYYVGDWAFESYGSPTQISALRTAKNNEANVVSSPPPPPTISGIPHHARTLAVSIAVPAFLLVCIGFLVLLRYRHSYACDTLRRLFFGFGAESRTEDEVSIEGMPERFSYQQLSVATKHFNEASKLGQGGFGNVYLGVLPSSGIPVAVKKIKRDSAQGQKEFMAEISIISQLRHRNLIQLLGWCKDVRREKYLLVYELMPNGSLDKALFGPPGRSNGKEPTSLSWQQRLNIVTGTAAALEYLHQGWRQQVIHRDIKSSNIMLDGEWNAKLGDFGLARLVDHQRAATTTAVAGTFGYIAPEAAATGHFTDKTDVFAFGAVILEVACGRRALAAYLPSEEMVLVDWVWQKLSEGALLSTVDKRLRGFDEFSMEVVLILGLLCSHPNPLARPSMRQVVEVLAGDIPVPSIPTFKPDPFSVMPQKFGIKNDEHFLDRKARSTACSTSGTELTVSTNVTDSTGVDTSKSSKPTL